MFATACFAFAVSAATADGSLRNRVHSKLISDDPFCPTWATDPEISFSYNASEWGGGLHASNPAGGWTGHAAQAGMNSAACAWVASCESSATDLAKCFGRCPTAVAIAQGESNWNPSAQSYDGFGRGLWQVGGPGALPPTPTFDAGCAGDNPGVSASASQCNAYNPLTLGAWVVEITNDGETFAPAGRCWTTCSGGACNSGTGWTGGWVPNFVSSTNSGGCKAVAESTNAADACSAAIQAISAVTVTAFEETGNCIVGGGVSAPAPNTCEGKTCSDGSTGETCKPYLDTPCVWWPVRKCIPCSCGAGWSNANVGGVACN